MSCDGFFFPLTANVDKIVGTVGNDVINAIMDNTIAVPAGTLGAIDEIDGGAGRDTLSIEANQALAGTIKNVEIFQFVGSSKVNNDVAIDASIYSGLDTISLKNVSDAAVQADKLATGFTIGFAGSTATTVTANYVAAATTANITADALTGTAVATLAGAALATVNVAGNTVGAGKIVINGVADVTKTVNIAAKTGTVAIDVNGNAVTTIDASASTSGMNVNVVASAADLTVKGGAGDDTLTMALGELSAKDSIDLGAGNDNAVFTGSAAVSDAQYLLLNKVVAEQITFANVGVTAIDAAKLTSSKIGLEGTTVNTVTNLQNADSLVVKGGAAVVVNAKALRDSADTTKFAADAGTVNVVSNTKDAIVTIGANVGAAGTGSDFAKLVLSGNGNVVFNNSATGNKAFEADASALKGALTITATTGAVDKITLGAGNDVVNLIAKGTAADTALVTSTYNATDVITGFTAGSDKLGVADLGTAGIKVLKYVDGGADFSQTVSNALAAAQAGAADVAYFTFGSDTYVVQDVANTGATAGVFDQNVDIVVKLVGQVNLTATDFVAVALV